MAAVQIPFVEKLQTKFQETYYTISKYKNEIIFVPSFISWDCFYVPAVFVKKREILKILSRENAFIYIPGVMKTGSTNLNFLCNFSRLPQCLMLACLLGGGG